MRNLRSFDDENRKKRGTGCTNRNARNRKQYCVKGKGPEGRKADAHGRRQEKGRDRSPAFQGGPWSASGNVGFRTLSQSQN